MDRWGILALAAGVACTATTDVKLGDESTLRVGARVRFLGVPEDSRCPLRAQCVWAGDALVVVETAPPVGDAKTATLHTNAAEGPGSLVWLHATLRLVRRDPYPETPGSIMPRDYIARFVTEDPGP